MRSLNFSLAALLLSSLAAAPAPTGSPAPADTIANPAVLPSPSDPSARAQALIDKGLAYLKSQQHPDGSWQNPNDPPAITAIVLKAFVRSPNYSVKDDFIKKGYDKLLSYQLENGGIYKDLLANYNTAIAISALAAAKDPEFQPHIDKAIAYLKRLQWTDTNSPAPDGEKVPKQWYGGWGYGGRARGGGRPDLSNVQLSMDALHDAGLQPSDPAYKAAIEFVTRQQNLSATNDQPWASNDGGFIYGPGDKGSGESMAGAYEDPSGTRRLRSYGSMTYAGLKSYIYAGLSKNDARVKAAFDWITNNWTLDQNPGMGTTDPALSTAGLYYYFHTLSRALNAYDQPVIVTKDGTPHDWRLELIRKLASLQHPDGSWSGDRRFMESNPHLVTAYVILALEEAQQDLKDHPLQH